MKSTATPALYISGTALYHRTEGVGVYTRRLIEGLAQYAPELSWRLIVPDDLAKEGRGLAGERAIVAPLRFRFGQSLLREIAGASAVACHLRRIAPEATLLCPYDFYAPSARPRRVVQVIHDCLPERFPQDNGGGLLRRWYRRRCLGWARRADCVITVSRWSAADLAHIARIPAEKIDVVPCWLSTRFDQRPTVAEIGAVRTRLGLPEDYLLYVGGFRRYKAVDRLLAAYALARQQGPLPPLVLAGRLPAQPARTRSLDVGACLAALKLDTEAVRCPGFIRDEDLPAVYAGARLFVFPSLHEGFGYAPAEACAMGTPVLVSDRAALPEVTPDPSCRFDPGDPADFGAKLRAAVTDPAAFRMPPNPAYTAKSGIVRWLSCLAPVMPPNPSSA